VSRLWTTAVDADAARQGLLVPTPPARPPQLDKRVFRGSTVVASGLLTRKQLRSSAWRRLRQDVYADATLPVTHRLLISAVGLVMPQGAGFTGRSAATLWGVPEVAGPADPVDVVVPAGRRWNAGPGVRVRSLPSGQGLVRRGRWLCANRVDTAVDLIRWGGTDDAVVLLDRLCHEGMVRLDDVRAAARQLPRCQGSAQARRVAELADGAAESPRKRGCVCSWFGPDSRLRSHSSACSTRTASSPGSTSPIPTSRSRSSTTGSGTAVPTPSWTTAAG
jgi:hypothetical protein